MKHPELLFLRQQIAAARKRLDDVKSFAPDHRDPQQEVYLLILHDLVLLQARSVEIIMEKLMQDEPLEEGE